MKIDVPLLKKTRGKIQGYVCKLISPKSKRLSILSKTKSYFIEYESFHMICGKYSHYMEGFLEKAKISLVIMAVIDDIDDSKGVVIMTVNSQLLCYDNWMVV